MDVSGSNKIVVDITHQYELEWDHDSIQVSLHNSNGVLAQKIWKDQQWGSTVNDIISVYDSTGFDSVMVKLIFGRDQTVAYRGWKIEELKLFHAEVEELGIQSENDFSPIQIGSASSAYPNPSTGSISIDIENWNEPLKITVFNLLGQEVFSESISHNSPERFTWRFDLQNHMSTPVSLSLIHI